MFNYPNEKPAKLARVEQRCHHCCKWFRVERTVVKQLEEQWKLIAKGYFVPFIDTRCTHCEEIQIAIEPGKYDKPNAAKKSCAVQYVVTL